MNPILAKLLTLLAQPAIPWIGGIAVAAGATALTGWLLKRRSTAALAGAVPVLEDVAKAELDVLAKDIANPKAIPADALKAAGDAVKADAGQLVQTAKAEIDNLANPNPPTTAVAPGGASVNLPSQTQSGGPK